MPKNENQPEEEKNDNELKSPPRPIQSTNESERPLSKDESLDIASSMHYGVRIYIKDQLVIFPSKKNDHSKVVTYEGEFIQDENEMS